MKIRLRQHCPVCKEKGKQNPLSREATEPEVSCVEGHNFASEEEAGAYSAIASEPEAPETTQATIQVSTPEPITASTVEAPIAIMEDLPELAASPARAPEKPKDPEPVTAPVPAPKKAAVAVAEAPANNGYKKAVKLPGGAMVIAVRIPDEFVSGLVAEAERQKEPIEAFFQRHIEWGLSCGWFNNL